MLSSIRDIAATKRFFKQAITNSAIKPEVITTDKYPPYIKAINQLKAQKLLFKDLMHRQCRYLNNIIEE